MPAERRRAKPDAVGERAGAPRRLAQQLDNAPPAGVGERRQRPVESGRRAQLNISILSPVAFSDSSTEKGRIFCAKVQTWPSGSLAR